MTDPPIVWVVISREGWPVEVRHHPKDPFCPSDVRMFGRHGAHVVEYISREEHDRIVDRFRREIAEFAE